MEPRELKSLKFDEKMEKMMVGGHFEKRNAYLLHTTMYAM
jgi:hypothetical protein